MLPSERLRQKITKENLWLYVLSLLEEGDAYGYELREKVKAKFGFKPGNVTAYRVLYALKHAGLVATSEGDVRGSKRQYYKITEKGREELEAGKGILRKTLAAI